MNINLVSITPEMATTWLGKNLKSNRPISKRLVKTYARDMTEKKWLVTGETIKFDLSGNLIDGQHRLNGVVESQATVLMYVVTRLDQSTVQVIDTGKSRSAGDALTISGIGENANHIAALARKIIAFQGGYIDVLKTKQIKVRGVSITNREIIEFVAANDLNEHILFGARAAYKQVAKVFNVGEWAFIHWLLISKSTDADLFLTRLASLENVSGDDPIRLLFEKITKSAISLSSLQKLQATVIVWNAFRKGEKLKVLKISNLDSSLPEVI